MNKKKFTVRRWEWQEVEHYVYADTPEEASEVANKTPFIRDYEKNNVKDCPEMDSNIHGWAIKQSGHDEPPVYVVEDEGW
jgi:hypothetical protein